MFFVDHVVAVRYCGVDGQWTNLSDYKQCIDFIDGKYLPKDDLSLLAPVRFSLDIYMSRDEYDKEYTMCYVKGNNGFIIQLFRRREGILFTLVCLSVYLSECLSVAKFQQFLSNY